MYIIRIVGLADGPPTPFDGQYLSAYDPDTPGEDPNGLPMTATMKTTADPSQALHFASMEEARNLYMQNAKPPYHIRMDGLPNRPLRAFSIEIKSYP